MSDKYMEIIKMGLYESVYQIHGKSLLCPDHSCTFNCPISDECNTLVNSCTHDDISMYLEEIKKVNPELFV